MDFREVVDKYQPELDRVELLLQQATRSQTPLLTTATTNLLLAGGKRIRPLLAILSSRVGGGDSGQSPTIAAAVELIHMATLVHDDVIDDADLRRGQPTVRARYGDRTAMYAGDFLFGQAVHLLTDIHDIAVHTEFAQAIVRMCAGEIEQIREFWDWQQTLRQYLRRIGRKTALLMAISCSLGATVAGATPTQVRLLRRFGFYTGLAFQITDDILDVTGQMEVVGKPVGGDLRQGNLTLPSLQAYWLGGPGALLPSLVRPGAPEEDMRQGLEIVQSSAGVAMSRQLAGRYMAKAATALTAIGLNPQENELSIVAEYVNQRML